MKTDDLIRVLAADLRGRQRPLGAMMAAGLIPALVFGAGALWLTLGYRPDLAQTLASPLSAARYVLGAALGVAGVRLALQLARPDGQRLARRWPLVAIGAVAAGLLVWALVTTPDPVRQLAVGTPTMLACLATIPVLSILPVAAILAALRKGATTAPARAGCMAGLGGGGLAAAVYALHCTEDSPVFFVTWYGLAIAGVALASTLAGTRLLRW